MSRSYKVSVTVNFARASSVPDFGLVFNFIPGDKSDGSENE